ncbi:hypothetical protein SB861_59350, partial [Paraburkholderia sp. SIMBA_049]
MPIRTVEYRDLDVTSALGRLLPFVTDSNRPIADLADRLPESHFSTAMLTTSVSTPETSSMASQGIFYSLHIVR